LGDDIIAAPIVTEGATKRDIYLPEGEWKDGNSDQAYTGPTSSRSWTMVSTTASWKSMMIGRIAMEP